MSPRCSGLVPNPAMGGWFGAVQKREIPTAAAGAQQWGRRNKQELMPRSST